MHINFFILNIVILFVLNTFLILGENVLIQRLLNFINLLLKMYGYLEIKFFTIVFLTLMLFFTLIQF